MNARTFTRAVKPLTNETLSSYTARVTAANFEPTDLRRVTLGAKANDADWLEALRARMPRPLPHFDLPTPGLVPCGCDGCARFSLTRRVCRLCSRGAHATQTSELTSIICRRHQVWVGASGQDHTQTAVTEEHLTELNHLRRLIRRGRVDPNLYFALAAALATDKKTETDLFPLLVRVIATLTALDTIRHALTPTTTYASRFKALVARLRPVARRDAVAVARVFWIYLRPTFAQIHRAAESGPSLTVKVHQQSVTLSGGDPVREAFVEQLKSCSTRPEDACAVAVTLRPSTLTDYGIAITDACERAHPVFVKVASVRQAPCKDCGRVSVHRGENDLATVAPKLAREFDAIKNDIPPELIPAKSSLKAWWRCPRGHSYEATPSNRLLNHLKCPICQNRVVVAGANDIATTHPEIAADLVTPELATTHHKGSELHAEFRCREGHPSYRVRIAERVRGLGCPECTPRPAPTHTPKLSEARPDVAAQWHPTANEGEPNWYSVGSNHTAVWLCENGHSYHQRIDRRTGGNNGCGICSKRVRVNGINDVTITDPQLITEWHPWRNWNEPDARTTLDRKYWWQCTAAKHDYQQTITHRRASRGCPQCEPDQRILREQLSAA